MMAFMVAEEAIPFVVNKAMIGLKALTAMIGSMEMMEKIFCQVAKEMIPLWVEMVMTLL